MNEFMESIQRQGYFVCDGFINDQDCEKLRNTLESLDKKKITHNDVDEFHGAHTALTANILPLSNEFIELAQDARFLQAASDFFENGRYPGEENHFQLHLMHARRVDQWAPAQHLHIDSRLCGVSPPLVMHAFIYLDDCLANESGATNVVPGSHRLNRYPDSTDLERAVPIYARKGSVMFLDSSLFHGSSTKSTPGSRWIITLAYSRWWMKQPFAIPYFTGWSTKLSEKEKKLFGFYNYADKNFSKRGIKARGQTPVLIPEE